MTKIQITQANDDWVTSWCKNKEQYAEFSHSRRNLLSELNECQFINKIIKESSNKEQLIQIIMNHQFPVIQIELFDTLKEISKNIEQTKSDRSIPGYSIKIWTRNTAKSTTN